MKNKTKILLSLIVIVFLIGCFCCMRISKAQNILFGANMNSSSYGKDIKPDVYKSIEDAYIIKSENVDNETIIYQKESGNVHTVFVIQINM